jgi:hypothetical protein
MNITIVGGGTAGWIAAYFICKSKPKQHNITVIESSDIGIIGAGEGSTGSMLDLLNGTYFDYNINVEDFMRETDGSVKLGIYHKNWTGDNSGYFAPLDASPSWTELEDNIFKYFYSKYGKEKMHLASEVGQQYSQQDISKPAAFHFDGHKVGKFFKKICMQDGVEVIDDVVEQVQTKNKNITSITLKSGQTIISDFFIDCTGFRRVLMKELGVKWHSYKDVLTVDSAMPFILPYEDNEKPKPFTSATALSAGWMWEIPLATRKGCGYVFDSNYITKEDAQKEIETYIGKEIEPIKWINFESGRSKKFWEGNCLCLGLASTFVEPLEATSIHTTIVQLLLWCQECLYRDSNKTITENNRHSYNQKVERLYDLTMDFISYHYQGERYDTPFWKNIVDKKIVSKNAGAFKEKSKNKIPGFLEINGIVGSPAVALWNWISAGIDVISQDQAEKELTQSNYSVTIKENKTSNKTKSYISYTQ